MTDPAPENRRPLKTRGSDIARRTAAALARRGISPDGLSALSVAVAVLGAALFALAATAEPWPRAAMLVGAAVAIQLRLACNLLDGMVAVEHGRGGPLGPIWNELPDRIADVLFLVGAGYCAWTAGFDAAQPLGWAVGVLAVTTAYVRELGRGLGFPADFQGPMAKPHRMAALTLTCLVAAVEPLWGWDGETILIGLSVIALGSLWTIVRRTRTLAGRLAAKE